MKQGIQNQPISEVKWVHRDTLKANNYNPNKVAPMELKLLIESILTCGWTTPIVIRSDNEIVDGFHRWTISADKRIYEKLEGMVPVVVMDDSMKKTEQISATITHNRARGSHYVMKMADIVRDLKDNHSQDDEWIKKHLGMEQEEIDRLYDNSNSTQTKSEDNFNEGWIGDFSK